MKGLWQKFWVRFVTTLLTAFLANSLMLLVFLAYSFLPRGGGVLDFAGGAVIHMNPWVAIVPVWIAAEIKALRTATPLPLGCYLIFLVVSALGTICLPILAVRFVSLEGAMVLGIVAAIVSVIVAAVAAMVYYWLWQRRVCPSPTTS